MEENEIFTDISLEPVTDRRTGETAIQVNCRMDGVQMPVRKLSPKDTLFIGEGPYTSEQQLWAARLAYRKEMRRNQRVQNLYIRRDKDGNFLVRCRIDGVQQLSSQLTRNEVEMIKRGLMTERELVDRHYSNVLMNDRGRVLDENVTRNLSMGLSLKKTQ